MQLYIIASYFPTETVLFICTIASYNYLVGKFGGEKCVAKLAIKSSMTHQTKTTQTFQLLYPFP